jgi:hypothetical protein
MKKVAYLAIDVHAGHLSPVVFPRPQTYVSRFLSV